MNREKQVNITVFLLRIVSAYLFMLYGGMKLFGWFNGTSFSDLSGLMLVAGLLEFFGGLLMLVGMWVRPVAFVLSGFMAVAYFMGHASQGHWYAPVVNDGASSVIFCFVFLFFAAYGAGKWSLGKNR
jgi:putative oxidoreductase